MIFLQSYANEDHALSGVLEHAYRSMEDFLAECLALDASQCLRPTIFLAACGPIGAGGAIVIHSSTSSHSLAGLLPAHPLPTRRAGTATLPPDLFYLAVLGVDLYLSLSVSPQQHRAQYGSHAACNRTSDHLSPFTHSVHRLWIVEKEDIAMSREMSIRAGMKYYAIVPRQGEIMR